MHPLTPSPPGSDPEKKAQHDSSLAKEDPEIGDIENFEDNEVFKQGGDVNFRTVGWPRATVIFLKIIFATGVLSIPDAMASLGAVGGALSLLGWSLLNTYTATVQVSILHLA